MKVIFFNFQKRHNSTKVPESGSGVEVDVVLKDQDSLSESLTIEVAANTWSGQRYLYTEANYKYYYVSDIRYITATVVRLMCQEDVLATFKTNIRTTTAFVERSSSNYNIALQDPYNCPTTQLDEYGTVVAAPIHFDSTKTGCAVLQVIGYDSDVISSKSGLSVTYVLNTAILSQLSDALNDNTVLESITKEFGLAMNAIIRMHWLNISYSDMPVTGSGEIVIGSWHSGIRTNVIAGSPVITGTRQVTFNLYNNTYKDLYLNRIPYTYVTMYLPYVGVVEVNPDLYVDGIINIDAYLDVSNGDILYKLRNNFISTNSAPHSTYRGLASVELPLSASSRNWTGALSGIISTLGSTLIGSSAGVVSGVAATVMTPLKVDTQSIGTVGSRTNTELGDQFIYTMTDVKLPAHGYMDGVNVVGLPCMRYLLLSTLSGYVKCRDASVSISGTESERNLINTTLNGEGVYLE